MSTSSQFDQKNGIECFYSSTVLFSFVIYVLPKRMSFAPVKDDIQDFRKYLGLKRYNYEFEDEFEDFET